ncbi:glycosyltransferase family 4 protein [Chitinophaga pendula]|uniref:glycosyltransferase family 4 protein n=1 Tax=Chitinophaga pendula TaxID=2849666 RepID=UPI001CECE2BC|nr:glycosyltransferase family 4 protein [Chitinophaga pendula]UCJ06328.1 glycosyltransferase family 4 protein [Chitinophaga pendula]
MEANNNVVLMVANTAWSLFKFRRGLIKHLIGSGYEIILLAPADEYVPRLEQIGAKFVSLEHLVAKGINPFKDVFLIRELVSHYRSIRPGLIFHYTIKPNVYGSIAARIAGIPSVSVITGLGYTFINNDLVSKIGRMVYKFALRYTDEAWFLNSDDMEVFLSRNIIPRGKARLLSTGEGIDAEEEFNPTNYTVDKWQGLNFIFIGRLLFDKGVEEYIQAAREVKATHPDVHFHLLGYINVNNPSAIGEDTVKGWVKEGLVTYHGSVDDVKPFILSSSCVVLPSYREGMSTILMESAALGLPIITTNIPGCRELVEDKVTGFLCEAKDAKGLAMQMDHFINMSDADRGQMGRLGRIKIERQFGLKKVFEIYSQIITRYVKAFR